MTLSKTRNIIAWGLQIIAAIILVKSLLSKFIATPESVYIFNLIGVEPAGRVLVGIFELVTAILLLTPRYSWMGAIFGIALMTGAITFHMTIIGIEVMGDEGFLFYQAGVVLACSIAILILTFPVAKKLFRQIFR